MPIENAACLYKTRLYLCSCSLRDDVCPHLGRLHAVPEDKKKSFVLPGAGQMPLALSRREVQIQLMGSYSVACPYLMFPELGL